MRPYLLPILFFSASCLGYGQENVGELTAKTATQPETQVVPQPTEENASEIVVEGAILKTIEATTLAASLAGTLSEVNAREGDVVQSGQPLARLKDQAVRIKLEQLRTQVEIAKKKQTNNINQRLAEKAKEVADNEYHRALQANERVADTYPINEIDRLRLMSDQAALEVERTLYDQEIAEFEVAVAISEYRQSHELYTRHQFVAPASGVVVAVEKRAGEWVEPGMDILRIVRIDSLRVEGFITARQAMQDLVGRSATVQLQAGESPTIATGKVVFVSPDVNPVNSQVRVFLEVDNQQGALRPGLRVKAVIDARP
ncbi:MAG: efflux RND transporter periplasmic adaptor subunit [Planctomycetales bacterium]|nr:efflux RND transporter periplasmic adaptor subunit [Planctomycetales bacterium]